MEQAKVHRVAVLENNTITHLVCSLCILVPATLLLCFSLELSEYFLQITQTDLITFLYNNLSRFHPIGDETLHELALDIPTRQVFFALRGAAHPVDEDFHCLGDGHCAGCVCGALLCWSKRSRSC
jgi:hypothetical protein